MMELDWRTFVRKYDRYSLRDFIHSKGISDEMASLIGITLNQEAIFGIGLIEFVIDECLFQQDLVQIVGGFDQLPRSFLPYLARHIAFNSRVVKVKYKKKAGVSIRYVLG